MSSSDGRYLSYAASAAPRRTAHELVRDTLRQAILSGEIERGSVLVQTEVARQLRVSTTPVREALRDLAAEGLIRLDAHKSAIVMRGSLNEMEEIYSLRLLLEPYCAEVAIARITPAELEQASEIHQRMVDTTHSEEWLALNTEFHQVLTDAAGLPRLSAFLKSLREAAQIYIGMRVHSAEEMASGNKDHGAILEGFRTKDVGAASAAILGHLEETRRQASEELV
ncbi:MAG: GntR family transcriptional regulator [Nocardioides sp.]